MWEVNFPKQNPTERILQPLDATNPVRVTVAKNIKNAAAQPLKDTPCYFDNYLTVQPLRTPI